MGRVSSLDGDLMDRFDGGHHMCVNLMAFCWDTCVIDESICIVEVFELYVVSA